MKPNKPDSKPLARSNSLRGNWTVAFFALEGITVSALFSFELSDQVFWILLGFGTLASICLPSFFYLNYALFYPGAVERKYFIPHGLKLKRVIGLEQVVAFRFTRLGDDTADGTGRIYYKKGGRDRVVRCSMDNDTAEKVGQAFRDNGIPVEIKTSWMPGSLFDGRIY